MSLESGKESQHRDLRQEILQISDGMYACHLRETA